MFGNSGDNGLATNAKIYSVAEMSMDTNANLYFSLNVNNRIRKITKTTNIITTVAGNGTNGFYGDGGFATNAELNNPYDVVVDSIGFFKKLYAIIFF
jgi:hypothetical protein